MSVPSDYLSLSIKAMRNLKAAGRLNVVYGLAKALGTKRDDQSDTLLPCKRMPMGLIEFCVQFFTSSHEVFV